MAMMLNKTGGKGGRRRRKGMQSEINVTPFVDVMLVLLIVFMITAPLMQPGIEVNLPDAEAKPLAQSHGDVLSLTIQTDGSLYLQDEKLTMRELRPKLRAIIANGYDGVIYIRGDKEITLGDAAEVLAAVQDAGFNRAAIQTDPNAR